MDFDEFLMNAIGLVIFLTFAAILCGVVIPGLILVGHQLWADVFKLF